MTRIYSAAELAQIATDPMKVDRKLNDIMTRANERAAQGHRSVDYIIRETDPLYKPVTERLEKLGYEITYYPASHQMGHGYLTIEW